MSNGLRILIFDDTCRTSRFGVGLTHSWIAGAKLYGTLGRFDHARGVQSWPDALQWLAELEAERPIAEVQFWGHGKWGKLFIAGSVLTADVLDAAHPLNHWMCAIRDRMTPESLWWFRTCETFGGTIGHEFARRWTDFFGCPAAGHTYIIGPLQSGLHALRPGEEPTWPAIEGVAVGDAAAPKQALWSIPGAPSTISCLQPNLPAWAFSAGEEHSP